jgi:hypothetical protein
VSDGLPNGVWYRVKQGMRGLLVLDRQRNPVVYMLCQPATRYYEVMTRADWMPVRIGEVIQKSDGWTGAGFTATGTRRSGSSAFTSFTRSLTGQRSIRSLGQGWGRACALYSAVIPWTTCSR